MRLVSWLIPFVLITASPADAERIFASTPGFGPFLQLASFDSTGEGLGGPGVIAGFQSGEYLPAIDFRPRTGQLYGVAVNGTAARLIVIHLGPLTFTQVGNPFPVSGALFGLSFDPTSDRIRLVSDAGINLLVNPDTGVVTTQPPLNPGTPNVIAVAHTNNKAGATTTTLYGIDSVAETLVTIDPVSGTVTTVGPVSLGPAPLEVGFDIAPSGTAFLVVSNPPSGTSIFTVDLTTGGQTLVGSVAVPTRSIAVPTPQRILVTGAGPGGGPHVRVFDATGNSLFSFFPYPAAFTGGVHTAACDVNGDGFPDIVTGAGAGGGPHVRVFDGLSGEPLAGPLSSFLAFPVAFTGGVFVGCADLDGDGKGDVIVSAGPGGGPHVRVLSGATGAELPPPLGSFFPYSLAFTGGVFVGGTP